MFINAFRPLSIQLLYAVVGNNLVSMVMELKSVLHIVKHCSKFRVNYQTLVYFYHLLQESADERPLNASSEFTKVTK